MSTRPVTFGAFISEKRKRLGLSQKEVAAQIIKEDGTAISAQYLNDVEHGRRNPPSGYILEQLAAILEESNDYLYYLAGQMPSDLRSSSEEQRVVEEAFKAFRRTLMGQC